MVEKQAPPAAYADFQDEPRSGWLRTLVQFFAIPLLIVLFAVGLYLGIRVLVGGGPETAADFVALLRSDTINRRWQAAYELGMRLQADPIPAEFRDPALVGALGQALTDARAEKEDPPRMAMMVLRILRRIGDAGAIPAVRAALEDEHPWIRSHAVLAVAALQDDASRGRIAALARDDDPGTRRAALEALASMDQLEGAPYRLSEETRGIALAHLGHTHEDVRFTAALVLAHAGDRANSLPMLKKMLDRSYLEGFEFDDRLGALSRHRLHSNVLLAAIRGLVRLECGDDAEALQALRRLADPDSEGDAVVRDAARDALKTLAGNKD